MHEVLVVTSTVFVEEPTSGKGDPNGRRSCPTDRILGRGRPR
jgi:hypothetical protein